MQGELVPALSDSERVRLAELEATIERDLMTFVEVGLALRAVRDEGLYRDVTPPTFAAYLRQRWGMGETHGYRLIDAARVSEAISPFGEVAIPNEATARLLVPWLDRDVEEQTGIAEVWRSIAPALYGERVTAERVRQALAAAGHTSDDRYRASGGPVNRRILLGQVGDRLDRAQVRLVRFVERELGDEPLAPTARETAARYAAWSAGMSAVLERLAEGEPVPRGAELYALLGMEEL